MATVLRSFIIYLLLLVLFRIAGKRALAQITTFDFLLLIIISEGVQQALLGLDYSITNAVLVVTTLIGMDVLFSLINDRFRFTSLWTDSAPLVLVENGKLLKERMKKARIDESEILEQARLLQGIGQMEEIQYAILERSGGITVIPKPKTTMIPSP